MFRREPCQNVSQCSSVPVSWVHALCLQTRVARQYPSCSKTCLQARLGDYGKMKPDECTYMTEELITPRHLSVLQSISFFISDHLQCLFSPLDVSAVGLNGFGIMDFFMHPFCKVGHPAVHTQLPLKCLFPTVSLTSLQMRTAFFLNFPVQFFSLDLKTCSKHGPKDLDPPLFNVFHDYFLKYHFFPDSFDSICFFVLVELNY